MSSPIVISSDDEAERSEAEEESRNLQCYAYKLIASYIQFTVYFPCLEKNPLGSGFGYFLFANLSNSIYRFWYSDDIIGSDDFIVVFSLDNAEVRGTWRGTTRKNSVVEL